MGATYLDEKGNEIPFIMGCYGIGMNRIVAAAVEAGHDDNGIIWPLPLAPYQVLVVPLQVQNAAVMEQAAGARDVSSTAAGLDVLVDDRDQRPGVKFKDADLIGIPLRVVIGERGLKEGTIEVKWRTEPEAQQVAGGNGRRGDPGRGRGDAQASRTTECAERRNGPGRGDEAVMSRIIPPAPGLPYVLLGLLTLVSLRRAVRHLAGRPRRRAAPTGRPTGPSSGSSIASVFGLAVALFVACVTIGWWYRPARPDTDGRRPADPGRSQTSR